MKKTLSYLIAGIFSLACNREIPEKEYLNCKWGLYENYDDTWKEYMGEKIHHTSANWNSWTYYLSKANKNKRVGKIWFPDLDGDGCIREVKWDYNKNKEIEIRKTKPSEWKYGYELIE